ncbi:multiple epidermal growth factor-like domains protein 10 [Saccostrea cucullata]|uniref:multiple epidermal growth factor-like domains protein 10 n=1 Tax=Saccostrea cuccullata TaxID=36930 RepID=UPI002ED2E8AA
MEVSRLLVATAFFAACIVGIAAQTGPNVCQRTETVYQRRRVCAYRTWLSCCYYRYVLKCAYRRVSYCCSGYKNVANRCIPVCFGQTDRSGCNNVGTCVAPNTCRCDSGYSGPQCDNSKIL